MQGRLLRPGQDGDRQGVDRRVRPAPLPGRADQPAAGGPGRWSSQIIYLHLGASEQKLARVRESMLTLTKGWDHDQIREIVREALEETVEPIIYAEALDLIEAHRAAGHKVYLVSASPEEIVAAAGRAPGRRRLHRHPGGGRRGGPLRRGDGVLRLRSVQGRGHAGAGRGRRASTSPSPRRYSDSYTDLPMLEAVGHPVAVNPDRVLAKVAQRARLGGHAVHQAGPAARPGQRPQPVDDRRRGRHHRRRAAGRWWPGGWRADAAGTTRRPSGATGVLGQAAAGEPRARAGAGLLRKDGAAWRRRHPGQR